ncbi:hypothetical protein GCM10009113_28570 [Marinobacter szutsaonensis]
MGRTRAAIECRPNVGADINTLRRGVTTVHQIPNLLPTLPLVAYPGLVMM